jgi:predicted ribosome-associated RNA-binding protein Tma20
MPWKEFLDGEILDASEVNTYFMNQAVLVFPSETARNAAITSPNEGMFSYITEDEAIYIYQDSAWTPQLALIENDAVTTVKILNEAVTTAKLDDGAVTSIKLGSDLDLNGTTEIDEIIETVVISETGLTGLVQINAKSGSVHYFKINSAANWTWNLRGDGTTSLDSMMDAGQAITFSLFAKNGTSGFRPTSITVDTSATVVTRWFGGNAPTTGNTNSVDCYTITVIKMDDSEFDVFVSQSKFAIPA